jgi:nucleotide-binding universal stress UspA family protein
MARYVERSAAIVKARVTLLHVVDLASYNGFELYLRRPQEIALDHIEVGRERLNQFLVEEFPLDQYQRLIVAGDPATEIARVAKEGGFSLIIMPTHAGAFRRMLLGSTTAKVLDEAECPVLTSHHAETIAPRPLNHREWLCAVGLGPDTARVLRFAAQATAENRVHLVLIHAMRGPAADLSVGLDLKERILAAERAQVAELIGEIERSTGLKAPLRVILGPIKEALLESAREADADALVIGRSPHSGDYGRLRDLTYAMIRDSPCPVLSV